MVLNTTQPMSPLPIENKENVVFKQAPPPSSVLRHSNGRRQRSRPNNSPSPVILAREAARDPGRRRTQSPPFITPTRSIGRAVEDGDIEMSDSATPTDDAVSQRRVQLPKHLQRPAFRTIAPAAIEAVDPELKDVAIEYIQQTLQAAGPRLLRVAATTHAHPPRSTLPRELQVIVNDISADAPTHLFAVYSKPTTRVTIHPAHALILAAQCAHLPPLPKSQTTTPSVAGGSLTLPVVPLCLPSPTTFPILLHYLYTKRADHLLASLLPMPPRDSQSPEQLSQSLAATFTQHALLSHASKVHGLWSNSAALGVFDDKLWRTIEMVWSVILDALAVSTGATWKKGKATEQIQAQL